MALTLVWVGLGVLLDNPWILVLLLPAVLLVHFGVVRREERYLESRFGEEYRRYERTSMNRRFRILSLN